MNHRWKQASLQNLLKYNKWLLVSVVALSISSLLLGVASLNKEDRWVILPANDTDNRMEISNKQLYPSYLNNWAIHIAKEMFTTSPAEVVNQHAQIQKISSATKELGKFFKEQLAFVQGNNASSVFFIKKTSPVNGGVRVNGTLHYWFAGSSEKIAMEKSYLIFYKQAARGLILLSNIEEDKEFFKGKK